MRCCRLVMWSGKPHCRTRVEMDQLSSGFFLLSDASLASWANFSKNWSESPQVWCDRMC